MPSPNCGISLHLPAEVAASYHGALVALKKAEIPHLIGGAYALAFYTGIQRQTKDFDLFLQPSDCERALVALAEHGFRTETVFPYWLSKAFAGDHTIDLIVRAPNGVAEVDRHWLERGLPCEVLGTEARVCALEEILVTKLFVLNNDRNDLADVMHLLYSGIERLDWPRLLGLLGPFWHVLLAQLVLFGFVYPSERHRVPQREFERLVDRWREQQQDPNPGSRTCNGPLLSHSQYKIDIAERNFHDGRLQPSGHMSPRDLIDATISTDDPQRPGTLAALRHEQGGEKAVGAEQAVAATTGKP